MKNYVLKIAKIDNENNFVNVLITSDFDYAKEQHSKYLSDLSNKYVELWETTENKCILYTQGN